MVTNKKKNHWIEFGKLEMKIIDLIMNSGYDFYELMGMLSHMQFELERITGKKIDEFKRFEEFK
jgi:hypothetical protein